jgi:hypothetical protein
MSSSTVYFLEQTNNVFSLTKGIKNLTKKFNTKQELRLERENIEGLVCPRSGR